MHLGPGVAIEEGDYCRSKCADMHCRRPNDAIWNATLIMNHFVQAHVRERHEGVAEQQGQRHGHAGSLCA